jgi:glutamyl-tRNA synthetase/glutamyl-Q tRNA(Asp) synthetase
MISLLHASAIQKLNALKEPIVTRFAPAPSGYLHLGHLAGALYVKGFAKALDGAMLLRIEDHDRKRSRREYETAILEDLEWLGLSADFGRADEFAGRSDYRQSDREELYDLLYRRLREMYRIYRCDCTRERLSGLGPVYDGRCRNRGINAPNVGYRIVLEDTGIRYCDLFAGELIGYPFRECGDLLLRDRMGNWSYQYAVTVDDFLQGVNLVVRGMDIMESTARQIQLARMIGRCVDPLFAHHPLLIGGDGKKLSKRQFSESIGKLRSGGATPEELIGVAVCSLGFIPDPIPLDFDDAYHAMGFDRISRAARSGTLRPPPPSAPANRPDGP